MKKQYILLPLLFLISSLVYGCNILPKTPTPTPMDTITPTATSTNTPTPTLTPSPTSTWGVEVPGGYVVIDDFDGNGQLDPNIWSRYNEGNLDDCPIEQRAHALTIDCKPIDETILWGIYPREQIYKDAKGIAIAAKVLNPSDESDRWAKLQLLLKFMDSNKEVLLTYNIILRGSILHVEQEDRLNNYAKFEIGQENISYDEMQTVQIERVENALLFFLNGSQIGTFDLNLPPSVTQQSWAIEGRVEVDKSGSTSRKLEAHVYWAAYLPSVTSKEECIPPYPDPMFYSCFDGVGPTAGSFQEKDGKLYGIYKNDTTSFDGGGLYTVSVSEQAKYIEFDFSILSGTSNGMLALRSYCSAGGGFFVQFFGDGNWNGHYTNSNGNKDYNGGVFVVGEENNVKIVQTDSGVNIIFNDAPLTTLLPCDDVGKKIELFMAASPTESVEGYFDNFGAWKTAPDNP